MEHAKLLDDVVHEVVFFSTVVLLFRSNLQASEGAHDLYAEHHIPPHPSWLHCTVFYFLASNLQYAANGYFGRYMIDEVECSRYMATAG